MYEESQPPFEPTPFEIEVTIKIKGTFSTDNPERLNIHLDHKCVDEAKTEIRMQLIKHIEENLPVEIETFGFGANFIPVPTQASFSEK